MTTTPPRLYLLDVEGTVAPISLIYEQLFPYAREHFEEFLEEHDADKPSLPTWGFLSRKIAPIQKLRKSLTPLIRIRQSHI
jgi:methionine salvage enolase-phosphatase E1